MTLTLKEADERLREITETLTGGLQDLMRDVMAAELPPMYVGKTWVLEQDGNPWHGFEVKCVREDSRFTKTEQCWNNQCFVFASGVVSHRTPIINCIDPRFWTGLVVGKRVRLYEDSEGSIIVKARKEHYEWSTGLKRTFADWCVLAAIEASGISVMPYAQSKGNYEPPEGT